MKRIISILLILILSLGVLSACTPANPPVVTDPPATQYRPGDVRDYVRSMYTDLIDNNVTKKDFTLVSVVSLYGAKYTIDWTVDTEAITVVPSADGLEVTVDVPETVEADLNYKLTGTVLAPDATSAELVFDLVVPAPKADPVLDMMGNTNNVSISTTQAVFQANGVTFTNDKASSTTDVKLYDYAYRAYAGSTVKIEYPGMRKIVITVDDYDGNGKTYMAGFDGMVVEGATIIRNHDVITILFLDGAVDVFQSTNLASQTRIEKIEVFTTLTAEDIAMGEAANGGNGGETSEYQAPAADTAFKWFMEIGGLNYYFKVGNLDQDKYLLTTTDVAEAADIFFEVVDGGYHIYFMDGDVKTYINTIGYKGSKGYLSCKFSLGTEPNCVWTYNEIFGILEVTAECDGVDGTNPDTFFAGTHGSYTTISLSGSYYKGQISSGTQFPARLVLSSEAGNQTHTHNFQNGQCACGEKDPNYVPPQADANALTSLKTGDKVYIVAPAYNMALSADKVSAGSYYNKGVDVSGGFAGLTNAEIWEVTVNADGSYTFTSLTGSTLALADQYSSFNDTGANKSWVLEEVSAGIYKVKNTVRGLYIEWYAEKNNWSAFGTANSDLFELSFYAHELAEGGEVTPPAHEHNFVDGKCECGETDPTYQPPQGETNALTSLKTGDKVYIVCPSHNMALSATKTGYYNVGIDVSGGLTGLTDAEVWEVTVNADGTYSFTSLTGSVLALADSFSSLNDTGANKSWALEEVSAGLFKVKNTGRGNYLEWYESMNNWSTYSKADSNLFELSFYAYELAEGGEVTPPAHEHSFVEGKCECGEEDPTYVPEKPEEGGDEVVSGGSADFDSLLPGSNGDSSYTKTHTTTDGWVIANSAIQAGGSNDVNPQFKVVGPDNTHKAVCLNGKTSAPGKLTSPTLKGGISKLTMNYTKMFTDTKLSVTITVTDLTTGAVYTHVVEREEAKDTKYVVWTDEWVLDTAIEGDFTIEIVNNCPTAQNSNKDRITILDLSWTK